MSMHMAEEAFKGLILLKGIRILWLLEMVSENILLLISRCYVVAKYIGALQISYITGLSTTVQYLK